MIVIDVEATGVDPNKHSIVSIGAIEFENPENQFYVECRPWEGADISDEAMEVNGFTVEQIYSFKKSLKEGLQEFSEWASRLEDHTFAGQNVGVFDFHFLMSSFHRYHLNWNFPHRTIDTHTLAYMHMVKRGITPPIKKKRTAINSEMVQEYTGTPEEPTPHNALNGAKVAAEAISRLLYDRPLLLEFKDSPIPWLK